MKTKLKEVTQTEFPIAKSVPIPPGAGMQPKYPYRSMEVGDSFFIEGLSAAQMSGQNNNYSQKLGGKFIGRTVTENGTTGCRVWRVE